MIVTRYSIDPTHGRVLALKLMMSYKEMDNEWVTNYYAWLKVTNYYVWLKEEEKNTLELLVAC